MAAGLAIALAVALMLWAQREWRAVRRAQRFRRRFPADASGIVIGAEPRTYVGDPHRALLLVHGYNDTPASLDDMARAVNAAGWTVRLPLLPGHGRSLEAWDDWRGEDAVAAVRAEYAALRATHATVVVGGLSMGGALATWIAAEADVDGLLLFAPIFFVPRPMEVAVSTARVWSLVTRHVSGGGARSLRDPEAQRRSISYGCSTRRSLEALEYVARGIVPRLGFAKAPTLVCQSREDNRLPEDQSRHAFARLGAADKTVHWVEGAGHVLTMDYGWPALAATVVAWLDARWPAADAAPRGAPQDAPQGTAD
jgi:carboxylesterase